MYHRSTEKALEIKKKRGEGLVRYATLAEVHFGLCFKAEHCQETAVLRKVHYVSQEVGCSPANGQKDDWISKDIGGFLE